MFRKQTEIFFKCTVFHLVQNVIVMKCDDYTRHADISKYCLSAITNAIMGYCCFPYWRIHTKTES